MQGGWREAVNYFYFIPEAGIADFFGGISMKLKTGQKCAFGLGAFGKDIVYMLISSYLLYYYNVVLGMSSVFIGTVMMAARIFDAFNDPVMGIIVAKTRTRWGQVQALDFCRHGAQCRDHLCFICYS